MTNRLPPEIKCAKAVEIDSGVTRALTVRADSSCHFFEPFPAGDYVVQLRLDWSDIDNTTGNPTLDADFCIPGTTKFDKTMKRHPAHQTKKEKDNSINMYLYEFEYEDIKLRLIVELTIAREIAGRARIAHENEY
ncbi:MAG: hypothetical protein KF762_01610 [Acidobacteria bacterium]|nr:hypothetical protein [Acidobacteriota bacterium]